MEDALFMSDDIGSRVKNRLKLERKSIMWLSQSIQYSHAYCTRVLSDNPKISLPASHDFVVSVNGLFPDLNLPVPEKGKKGRPKQKKNES